MLGLIGWQHQDDDGSLPLAGGQQLRRDDQHPALRQPCQKYQEQTQDQRGPQGRHAQGVPGGNYEAQAVARPEGTRRR